MENIDRILKTCYDNFADFMEKNTIGSEVVTYGIATAGLLLASYRIRPFSKFTNPLKVPNHFIRSKIPLRGTVTRIEPGNGVVVMVHHHSLLPLPRLRQNKDLPVKVAGVDVNGYGISWLQTVVAGQKIIFIPYSKDPNYLVCEVKLRQNKNEFLDVGKELVKLGFGTVNRLDQRLLRDKEILSYQKKLVLAEKWAERRRNGLWFFKIDPTLMWRMKMSLEAKLKSKLPMIARQLEV